MSLPLAVETKDWQSIVRGEHDARLLDHLNADCYLATSGHMAMANASNPLYEPYVDRLRLEQGLNRPRWPNNAPFAVCLTHDVDQVSKRNSRMHLRRLARQGRSLLGGFDSRAWRGFQASAFHLGKSLLHWGEDPLHCYEVWLEMEAEVGAKSTFLFLPDEYRRPHHTDGNYRYGDVVRFDGRRCQVSEMMREIHARGWEVGLHASWQTSDDVDEMKRQKAQVEQAIGDEVRSVRHHHLHCDVRHTPRVHHEAGLRVDSSFGLNDNIGFRYGTAYPTQMYDLPRNAPLDVWELPLVIQERALVETLSGGSVERALEWGTVLADRVEEVSGVLTLLWHPECLLIDSWVQTYQALLRVLHQRGAWFGTMSEVSDWWIANCHHQHNGCLSA